MTTHEAKGPTWHNELIEIVLAVKKGDTIIVPNPQVIEIATKALLQLRPDLIGVPNLNIIIETRKNE